MTDEQLLRRIAARDTEKYPLDKEDSDWLIAKLRESQAECAKLEGIYASAVNGRAEMRTALKEERAIAERDAANVKLATAVELLIAYTRDELEVRKFLATVWP